MSRGFIAFTATEIIQDLINFLFPQSPLPTQRALHTDMSSTGSIRRNKTAMYFNETRAQQLPNRKKEVKLSLQDDRICYAKRN
jgi:hypothetical protein